MKQFIEHIRKSIFDREYYEAIPSRPMSFSWKYYFSFTMFLAVIMTILFSIPLIPLANRVLRELPEKLYAYYPDELELRLVNGHLSTNVSEPYYLPFPDLWKAGVGESAVEHLAIIDTTASPTLEGLQASHALMWISGTSVAVIDERSGMRVSPFTSEMTGTLSESALRGFVSGIEPYFRFAAPILVLVLFFGLMMGFLVNLLYLLVAAILVFLVGRALKRDWGYGTSYRIALHAVTLPLLIQQALLLLPFGSKIDLPLFFTVLLVGVVLVNYHTPHAAPAPSPVTPPESSGPSA
jgi:hypothetical protein